MGRELSVRRDGLQLVHPALQAAQWSWGIDCETGTAESRVRRSDGKVTGSLREDLEETLVFELSREV